MEQLKALSGLAALLAGFALMSFLNFQFAVTDDYNSALLPLFSLTTSITVGVEVASLVLCSLMLANILRISKTYVSEQEEAEFMHRCQVFVSNYRPGAHPPAPPRTFAAYWSHRCEREWGTAFRLFSTGIPCFFVNLALAGWIKFHASSTPTSAALVTACMGVALAWNLYTHRKWGRYLLQDDDPGQDAGYRVSQPPVGLPFDWHLPPLTASGLQPPPPLSHLHVVAPPPPGFGEAAHGQGHPEARGARYPAGEMLVQLSDSAHPLGALDTPRAGSTGVGTARSSRTEAASVEGERRRRGEGADPTGVECVPGVQYAV